MTKFEDFFSFPKAPPIANDEGLKGSYFEKECGGGNIEGRRGLEKGTHNTYLGAQS